MEIHELSLTSQLNELKNGSFTSTELTQHYLDRISNFDEDINHFKRYNKRDFKKILKQIKHKKVDLFYYDSIGYILSLMSKFFISDYRKNFEKKLIFWDSLIWISKILDKIVLRLFGKSLLVIIKKTK